MLMNPKKLYRLYRDEGLSVRRRRGRKRARGTRTPMPLALMPNQRWSLGPRHGPSDRRPSGLNRWCRDGQPFPWLDGGQVRGVAQVRSPWCLNRWRTRLALAVIDDCCRENLCLVADTSISGARVARELDALVRIYGKPACIVSDNGTEFTSRAILKWADQNGVAWHYIDPGKPQRDTPSSKASTAACATSC